MQSEAHYLFGFLRNSSRVGPSRPRGSSGTMKRFPAKVKGSRLDREERRHSHRAAPDRPRRMAAWRLHGGRGHSYSQQVLVGTVPRTLSRPQRPTATGCLTAQGKEQPSPLGASSPVFDHQFLGIIHQDVELLIGDNDAICLLRQLHHEPARRGGITNDLVTSPSHPQASGNMNLQLHFESDKGCPR